jgi:GNAT superfamily N-acetyltransferase
MNENAVKKYKKISTHYAAEMTKVLSEPVEISFTLSDGDEGGFAYRIIVAATTLRFGKVGGFVLAAFPGNCGIMVLCHLMSNIVKKGVGTLCIKLAEEIAKSAGYTLLLGTTNHLNAGVVGILKRLGYTSVVDLHFNNGRTCNDIETWMKKI